MNQRQQEAQMRELLARYIRGECTEGEASLMEKWYERVAGEKRTVRMLSPADEERLVQELCKAMAIKEESGDGNGNEPSKNGEKTDGPEEEPEAEDKEETAPSGEGGLQRRRRRIFRYAAIWIGLLIFSGGAWIIWNRRSYRPAPSAAAFIEVSTGYQQVRKVILPDSSVVWLNSATHLAYHPDFTAHRELRLNGEAFFEVVPDKGLPFVVKAGRAVAHVLGTSFNISAYPGAGQLRISLKSGRIGIGYEGGGGEGLKILNPGELLIYDNESGTDEVVREAPTEMDEWTAGLLSFYKTPLKEALAQIEARYGVHFTYDRPLPTGRTVTARFENTALEKVLAGLSFGWDLHFTKGVDTIHVTPK